MLHSMKAELHTSQPAWFNSTPSASHAAFAACFCRLLLP
jgi:hypothetical protein